MNKFYSLALEKDARPATVLNALVFAVREIDGLKSGLRDQFAMSALNGLISHYGNRYRPRRRGENCAELAYEYADAMMKERELSNAEKNDG